MGALLLLKADQLNHIFLSNKKERYFKMLKKRVFPLAYG